MSPFVKMEIVSDVNAGKTKRILVNLDQIVYVERRPWPVAGKPSFNFGFPRGNSTMDSVIVFEDEAARICKMLGHAVRDLT